jgi:uncharacterized RDD family membrane protein YckC
MRPCAGAILRATLVLAVALGWRPGGALAAPPPDDDDDGPGHAWVIVELVVKPHARASPAAAAHQQEPPRRAWSLIHIPPGGAEGGAASGHIRIAAWLRERPAAACYLGSRVYMAFHGRGDESPAAGWRVLTVAAVRGPGAIWRNDPEGRFEALPPLPGGTELAGLAATPRGLVALLVTGERADGPPVPWRLLLARGSEWVDLMTGTGAPGPGTKGLPPIADVVPLGVTSSPGGIVLLTASRDGTEHRLWTGRFVAASSGSQAEPALEWTSVPCLVDSALADGGPQHSLRLLPAGERPLLVRWTSDRGLRLWRLGEGEAAHLADLPDAPEQCGVGTVVESGTAIVIWPASREPYASLPRPEDFRVVAVSVPTGRVLRDGPGIGTPVVSARDLSVLAIMVVVAMAAILLSLLRTDGTGQPVLPDGVRPAEGGRRAIAAGIDFAIGAVVSGWIHGVNPLSIVGLGPSRLPGGDILPLLTALGIAMVHCTILEWLAGRSIGKALTGCRVIRVVRDSVPDGGGLSAARPRLWQSAGRNLVKWGAPPVTVFAMSDRAGRHPGDLAVGTVVVVTVPAVARKADS